MVNMGCDGFDRALATEWAVISTGASARRSLRSWVGREPVLAGFESPHDVLLGIVGDVSLQDSIAVSQAVLRLARTDQLAARLLIQVMVPTLATECFRTRRVLRAERVTADGVEVVALVVGAAAEAIAGYSRLVVPYPLRTLRCRTIEIITRRRARLIRRARVESCELLDDRGDAGRIVEDDSPTASDLLAETLSTAVELGIVSGEDAELVWVTRHFDVSTRALARGDHRESERLRKRRTRAQRRLIENRDAFLAAGVAV
jgi:hypothetical protein